MGRTRILLGAALALAPLLAQAQTVFYRCVDKNGKKHYSATIPRECLGQPIEQLSRQGTVMGRIDPAADEKARQEKAAAAAKKREESAAAQEEARRNRALLATYTNEKDIEDARARALSDNTKRVKEIEGRIADIKKRQARYEKEMEFYRDGAKSAAKGAAPKVAKPPAKLLEDIQAAELDMRLQDQALEERRKEADSINARYDEDKKRFHALMSPRSGR
jgi:hypothetical protein